MKKFICIFLAVITAVSVLSVTAFSMGNRPEIDELIYEGSDADSVTISWSKAEGADLYYIYRLNVKNFVYELKGTTDKTQYTAENLDSGKTHYFRVLPVTVERGRKYPGKISDTVLCVTAPSGDLAVSTKDIAKNSVTLAWNKLPGATGYKVFYYDDVKGRYIAYNYTDKNYMTVKGFKENTQYKFKVRPFRWVGDALSYGEWSEEYSEYTHTDGTPNTKAQVARAYNTLINSIKKKSSLTMQYTKSVDTEFIGCSRQNLALTVENTSNLFSGSLTKTYKFTSGKSGNITITSLLEPYSKNATVSNTDIASFKVKEVENGYTVSMYLKNDNSDKPGYLYSDGSILLTDIRKLDTTPLVVNKADSFAQSVSVAFAVRDDEIKILKINAKVISDINFSVAGVSADARISYTLYERYGLSQ